MDEHEIIEGLRGIALAEPPLGFAPDDVADKAARRQRDRRVALGSGVAVTAVAVAAVALTAGPTPGPAGPGGPAASSSAPPVTSATVLPVHDLTEQSIRNRQHLRDVLGGVVPDAEQVKVGDFDQNYPDSADSWGSITAEVMFRDDAGPAAFNLTVAAASAAGDFEPLSKRCDPHPVDEHGKPVEVLKLPNGKPLRCTKIPQSDGSTVVVEETGSVVPGKNGDLRLARVNGLNAMHYRTDGSTVNIVNDDLVSGTMADEYGGEIGTRTRLPLTQQQLVTLVTDPAFTLD
jgi:hypothetical protein